MFAVDEENFLSTVESVVAMAQFGATEGERNASQLALSRLMKRASQRASYMTPTQAELFLSKVEHITGHRFAERLPVFPLGSQVLVSLMRDMRPLGEVIAVEGGQYTVRMQSGETLLATSNDLALATEQEIATARLSLVPPSSRKVWSKPSMYSLPLVGVCFTIGFCLSITMSEMHTSSQSMASETRNAFREIDGHGQPYAEGVQARKDYNAWLAGLSGESLAGALDGGKNHCLMTSQERIQTCLEATLRYALVVARSAKSADFKAGWNSLSKDQTP